LHRGLLLKNGFDEAQIEAIIQGDYEATSLTEEEIAIIPFC
jgi:hypothetical protein